MTIVEQAFLLASDLHASQRRKASIIPGGTPYLSHLMEVAGMVMACGGDDATVAAALLHDAVEDQGAHTIVRISAISEDVASLVLACTEVGTGTGTKSAWWVRKEAYAAHIADVPANVLLIIVADKLQSVRELRRSLRKYGDVAWSKLHGPKSEQRWWHETLVATMMSRLQTLQSTSHDALLIGVE